MLDRIYWIFSWKDKKTGKYFFLFLLPLLFVRYVIIFTLSGFNISICFCQHPGNLCQYFYCQCNCLYLIIKSGHWIQQDWVIPRENHTQFSYALTPYKSIFEFKIVGKLIYEDLLSSSSFTTGSWDIWLDSELSYYYY